MFRSLFLLLVLSLVAFSAEDAKKKAINSFTNCLERLEDKSEDAGRECRKEVEDLLKVQKRINFHSVKLAAINALTKKCNSAVETDKSRKK